MKKAISILALMALLLAAVPASAMDAANAVAQETGTIVAGGAVNIYEGLWDGAQVVGSLQPGTAVIVLQQFGDMYQVFARSERLVGWLKMDYVRVDNVSPVLYTGVVISQNVSIRESPTTRAQLLARAKNGEVLEILDEQDGWFTVNYWDSKNNVPIQGYVRTYFVVKNPTFITLTQSTYVYAMPHRSSKMVGQLSAGTQLVVIGEMDNYWVVNLRSASGFILKRDVEYDQVIGNG